MEKILLNAEKREEVGKALVKKIRKNGLIPAVCYKEGKETVNLKVNKRQLNDVLHTKAGENVLITLNVEGEKSKKERVVMIKEIQKEPLMGDIIHVDFSEISLTKAIKVKVPVVTHGEAKEVKREGGTVEHIIWEVEVECLPTEIPDKITVEIAEMKIGDFIYVKDLKVKQEVKILADPEAVVLTAKMPVIEEAPVEAAEGVEEPEVIAKGKKPEEGEEEEGEAKPEAKAKAEESQKKEDKK